MRPINESVQHVMEQFGIGRSEWWEESCRRELSRLPVLEEIGVANDLVTTNSLGRPIAPAREGIENFWKWYDGSVLVDDQGRPIVAFHGTSADFDEFQEKFAMRGAFGRGYYFTLQDDPEKKSLYGDRTMAVYLRVTKPADKPDLLKAIEKMSDDLNAMVDRREIDRDKLWSKEMDLKRAAMITGNLIADGFDGVMLTDDQDKDVVVFNSNQIKSAMVNKGTFRIDSNKITEDIMVNESVASVMLEFLVFEASEIQEIDSGKDEGPSAEDKAKVQKIMDDKSLPEKAEDGKAYIVHWADGRAVFATKSKKSIKDWLDKTGSWACIISIKYAKPEWKGKTLRVKA